MIALSSDELSTVLGILAEHVPSIEVCVFGSRTRAECKRFSDLDLALMTERPLPSSVLGHLRQAFSDSDLVFRVDLLDWAATSKAARRGIANQLVPLPVRRPDGVGNP